MAELFDSIVAGGFGRAISRTTAAQRECRDFVVEHQAELLCTSSRERYLRDVVICIGGFIGSDCDEPLSVSSFAQHQFFVAYDRLVYFVDKLDFLTRAVGAGVCVVAVGFEPRYMETMRLILEQRVSPALVVENAAASSSPAPISKRTVRPHLTSAQLRERIAAEEAAQGSESMSMPPPVLTMAEQLELEAAMQRDLARADADQRAAATAAAAARAASATNLC
jgi:hypothetical protein